MLKNIAGKLNGEVQIDLLITDAKVLNVFTMEFFEANVMIDRGMIIGFGAGNAKEIISASGKYLVPGLIDGHMHIESTMLSPIEYSKVALANGVTTVFADCHEIANVMGTAGIDYMLCNVEKALIDINVMLPSSVPCTLLEDSTHQIVANDLLAYYSDPFVYGLAEVMDYNRVATCDADYTKKMYDANRRNLTIDGHMAGLAGKQVDLLRNHGVATDHECETKQELHDRLSRGVAVQIREGSAAKNFTQLMPAVTIANNSRISFCSDDISIVDLIEHGSINNIIRKGISEGYQPELLLKMATYNAARTYNLNDKGAIAPGYVADLLLIDNLVEFTINRVFKDGVDVSSKIDFDLQHPKIDDELILNSVEIVVDSDQLDLQPKYPIVIEMRNGSLVAGKEQQSVNETSELAKVVVINRYGQPNYFVSYVRGFENLTGVIASSISHDSHNLVIIGKNDEQIRAMLDQIKQTSGGIYTLFNDSFEYLPLEIAGLMSYQTINQTYHQFKQLLNLVPELGIDEPFLAMSFLMLDVIPYLKITDQGLYDFENNQIIS